MANEHYSRKAKHQEVYQNRPIEQQYSNPPHKKKHRILKSIALLFLVFLIFIGFQFYQGIKNGRGSDVTTEEFHPMKPEDGSTNILLVGSDARPNDNAPSRSDTIMVMHLGRGLKNIKLVSIMRDTYVNIPGVGMNKINAAHAFGGVKLLSQTLDENFGLKINHYAKVNFQTFEEVMKALFPKGVFIDVEKDIALDDTTLQKGPQILNAHQLLNYARFRKDDEGDFGRVRRQQQVIQAVMKELKKPSQFIHLPKAAGVAFSHTETDLSLGRSFLLGGKQLITGKWTLEKLSIPVDNSWSYGNYPDAGSVLEINMETNKQALQDFFEN